MACSEVLTVRETLTFTAKLRTGEEPAARRRERVDATLKKLQLDHRAETRIGGDGKGISGGERRRLLRKALFPVRFST